MLPLLAGPPRKIKMEAPKRRAPPRILARMKKDAAERGVRRGPERSYLATALTRAAALSVCSQVKNLKFLSPFRRPKWPYWSVWE
jgi:hypothetical protein